MVLKKYTNKKAISFDDILMVPQYSDVQSRLDIDLTMNLNNSIILDMPIIASPMDTVCEEKMASSISEHGGLGIIHRFMSFEKQLKMVNLSSKDGKMVGAAIGAKGDIEEQAVKLFAAGAMVILIDTANGHSEYAINATKRVKHALKDLAHIMVGNVSTAEGYIKLSEAGADSVRVGIGGGSVCTTRVVSGHGVPTLTSVIDVKEAKETLGINAAIIADGGIRNTGDIVKSFAAGADAVMLGSMLAGTEESPGEILFDGSNKYKSFRGMASEEANEGRNIAIAEGVVRRVPFKGSLEEVIKNIRAGIGSGCSYSGVLKLEDLYENSMYMEVSTLSIKESRPHV